MISEEYLVFLNFIKKVVKIFLLKIFEIVIYLLGVIKDMILFVYIYFWLFLGFVIFVLCVDSVVVLYDFVVILN